MQNQQTNNVITSLNFVSASSVKAAEKNKPVPDGTNENEWETLDESSFSSPNSEKQVRDVNEAQLKKKMAEAPSSPIDEKKQIRDAKEAKLKEKLAEAFSPMIDEKKQVRDEKESKLKEKIAESRNVSGIESLKTLALTLEAELETVRKDFDEKAATVTKLEKELTKLRKKNVESNMRYCELCSQIDDMEDKLKTSKSFIKAMKEKVIEKEAENEKLKSSVKGGKKNTAGENDGTDPKAAEETICKLQFQLTEARRILAFLESKLNKSKKEKEELERANVNKIANLEYQVTQSKQIMDFVKNKLEASQEETRVVKDTVTDLQNKLTMSSSICKFAEGKLNTLFEQKQEVETAKAVLEKEVQALNSRLQLKNHLIEQNEQKFKSLVQDGKMQVSQTNAVRGQLYVAQKMVSFLQNAFADSEHEKLASGLDKKDDDEDTTEDTNLSDELAKSKDTIKALEHSLELARDEQSVALAQLHKFETSVKSLQNELSQSHKSDKQFKQQLKQQADTIATLTKELKHANKAKSTPPVFNPTDLQIDLEFRLTKVEVANAMLREEKIALEAELRRLGGSTCN